MCAQAKKASVILPKKVLVRNKKGELFNDILQLIEKEGLVWKATAIETPIDGHHQTLADRS